MPSKSAHLVAFLFVFLVSAGLHRFVYANLKRVILRDYPKLGSRIVRSFSVLFILMDSPFIFMFFRNRIKYDTTLLTQLLIYPFSVWQAIMIMWGAILIPFVIWRRGLSKAVSRVRDRVRQRAEDDDLDGMEPALEIATD